MDECSEELCYESGFSTEKVEKLASGIGCSSAVGVSSFNDVAGGNSKDCRIMLLKPATKLTLDPE